MRTAVTGAVLVGGGLLMATAPADDLMRRLLAARTFNQGFATVEYVACALVDLDFHLQPAPDNVDVNAFEEAALAVANCGVCAMTGMSITTSSSAESDAARKVRRDFIFIS